MFVICALNNVAAQEVFWWGLGVMLPLSNIIFRGLFSPVSLITLFVIMESRVHLRGSGDVYPIRTKHLNISTYNQNWPSHKSKETGCYFGLETQLAVNKTKMER